MCAITERNSDFRQATLLKRVFCSVHIHPICIWAPKALCYSIGVPLCVYIQATLAGNAASMLANNIIRHVP